MISGCCQSAAQRLIERTVDQRERVLVKRVNRSVQFTPRALATPGVCIAHYPSTPFWWRSFSLRKKIPPIAEAYSPRSMAAAENPSDIIDTRYNIGIIDSRGTINVFHPAPFRHRRHPRYRGLRPSHVSMVHNAPTIPSDVTSGVIQG